MLTHKQRKVFDKRKSREYLRDSRMSLFSTINACISSKTTYTEKMIYKYLEKHTEAELWDCSRRYFVPTHSFLDEFHAEDTP